MRAKRPRGIGLQLALVAALAAAASPSRAQSVPEKDAIISQLSRFDAAPELDITSLRQRVLEKSRSRSRNEPEPSKRPPIVPELLNLPTVTLDIHFDTDTPVVRPDSYQTVGRLADALVNASLLPYSFLIVGHSDSTGRREANVVLSQRRADAIRDVLVNTFKISAKRLQTLGVGEEQFIDQAHPTSPANLQIQILTVAKLPEQSEQPGQAAAAAPPPAKKPAKKR
ncbi:OmpA family protein [Bradyrhizobium sp. ARR65]|uniref:OmpA family protein n=1 Tax=Bradyrhizobium sp. ARR65 TaxID=1040989 RepID=UPI0004662593|nr:OmpA family protein [Bradyrhizobium sp. ARR65]